MRCRHCADPIQPCPHGCGRWRHTTTRMHVCNAYGHDVLEAMPPAAPIDVLEAIDGPGYEWYRELAAEWGGPTNAAGSGFVPAQPLPAVTQGGNP